MSRLRKFVKYRSQSNLSTEIGLTLFEKSTDGIIIVDSTGRCRHVNNAACQLFGYTRDELLHLPFSDLIPSREYDEVTGEIAGAKQADRAGDTLITRKDGAVLNVEMAVHAMDDGTYVSIIRDLSGQKRLSKELNHLTGIFGTLSRVNNVILHAANRDSLFQEICRAATDTGSFTLAAIGLIDETGKILRLAAWKGSKGDKPPYDELSLDSQVHDGALLNRALRSKKVVTSHDLQNESMSHYWHNEAVQRNLHSAAAVPFVFDGKIVGILTLAAAEVEAFQRSDIHLLEALGDNVAIGLERIKGAESRRNIERALLESEERYRSVFENTTVGLYRTTPDGKVLMANRALLHMLGYEALEELQKRDLSKEGFGPKYSREEFVSRIESEGQVTGLESGWTRRDGTIIYVRESARAVRDREGKTLYYEGSTEDVTERKLVEQSIMEKSFLLDEMSRMANIGAWEFRTDDLTGTWTEETARIHGLEFGMETNATMGLSFYEGVDRERIESAVKEAIENGKSYDLELELRAADGHRKWVRTIGHPIKEDGKVVKIRGTFQDITEAKQAKDRIRYLTRLYAALSQINQTIVRVKGRRELFASICDLALQFGEFPLAAVGLYDKKFHHIELNEWKGSGIPDRPYSVVDIELPQYRDGLLSSAIKEDRVVTSNDVPGLIETKHWKEVLLQYKLNAAAAVPFHIKGEVVGVLTIYAYETDIFMPEIIRLLEEMGLDISFALDAMEVDEESRRNEAALSEERDRIAMVAESAPGLIHSFRMRPDGTACMPYASSAIKDIYGYSAEDVANDLSPVFAHFHPDDVGHIFATIAESTRTMTMWHDEFRYIHPVKGEVWIEGRSMPVRENDGSITWHGFIQDVTVRKLAEKAIRESEERFRSIMEQMTDTVFVSGSNGVVIYVSPSCERMFGLSVEEITGRHFTEFIEAGDVERAGNSFRKTQTTGQPTKNLELTLRRKDGTTIIGEIDATPYNNGQVRGSVGVIRDITSRKRAEEELREIESKRNELEHQLIQAQKLESLGTLAGGIAHDFNNLLGVIMGYSALLKENGLDKESTKRSIESIEKASERGAALVSQLLTFARKTETLFKPVAVNEVIRDTVAFLTETFPRTITIATNLDERIPAVVGDSTQLHQVFMNLFINARDAMPQGGTVLVTSALMGREDAVSKFPAAADSEYIVVSVTDTGTGMDEKTRRKVFDPFFTTKGPGKGTGLGLAVVYSIVQSHGGFINLESDTGKGSTFEIYLPSAKIESEKESAASSTVYPGGTETILVIEDEEMLRNMMLDVLVPRGYSVLTAEDGEEGLEKFAIHQESINVVITDLGLPKLGGDQVFTRIKSIDPKVKVIIASGFIDPELRSRLSEAGANHFVQKPYVPSEILSVLRNILDSGE